MSVKKRILLLREDPKPPKPLRNKTSYTFLHIPCLKTKILKVVAPRVEYDYLLLTSKNALRAYKKKLPRAKKAVCIGQETALASGLKKPVTLKNGDSKKVALYFRKQKRGRIYFPRSKLADQTLPKALRKMGFQVKVVHSYTTIILNRRTRLLSLLKQKPVDAIYFTSPSTVTAFKRALRKEERDGLKVEYMSLGPTTAQAVRKQLT